MRCNVGVNPILLADQHLIAEYREIPMLVGSLEYWNWEIKSPIPQVFNLGVGHMNFLKNKLRYAQRRHDAVVAECNRRGFKCDTLRMHLNGLPMEFCQDWNPTIEDSMKLRARLKWKLTNKQQPFWRYNRKCLTNEELSKMITDIENSELFYV